MLVKCFVINKSFRCDAPEGSDCYATIAYIACPFKIKIGDRQVGTRWSVDPVKVLGGWLTLLQLSPVHLLTVSHGWAGRPTATFRRLWRLNRWGLLNSRIDVKWTSMNCLSSEKLQRGSQLWMQVCFTVYFLQINHCSQHGRLLISSALKLKKLETPCSECNEAASEATGTHSKRVTFSICLGFVYLNQLHS